MLGISIKPTIGIGDALQFSSVPENFYRATGKRLLDVSKPWFFDHNPFVTRDDKATPTKVVEMWNFSPKQFEWPIPKERKEQVYLSNAEIWALVWGVPMALNRPRLYQFEDVSFEKRQMILLHVNGMSHGIMPEHVVAHVLRKYGGTKQLYQIGPKDSPHLGLPKIDTPTLWDLAYVISQSRMLIGMDSGPSWIAACYPDVLVKKVRAKPSTDVFKTWVPLSINNIHSHWDDRCHQIFNTSEEDVGFTSSYRKI